MMIIDKILFAIFPMFEHIGANRKLEKKISANESILDYKIDPVSIETLIDEYKDTFLIKNRIEEKAKTNIIGITIAITIIIGAPNIVSIVEKKYDSIVLQWLTFFMLVFVVLLLLFAGILATKLLFDKNAMDCIVDNQDENNYGKCITNNRLRNIARNNMLYSSYACIRNALIILILILLICTLPISKQNTSLPKVVNNSEYEIVYSKEAINSLMSEYQENIENTIIKDIENREEANETSIGIIDETNNLFIKYRKENGEIIVELIERFDQKYIVNN